MGHGNHRPEIKLPDHCLSFYFVQTFMRVLVTSNFDDISIKNE